MSSSIRLFTFVIVALLFSACSQQEVVQNEEGVFVLGSVEESQTSERGISPGSRSIEIDAINGRFVLNGIQGDVASFTFTKRARGTSVEKARSLLEKIEIDEQGDDLTYSISVDTPERALSAVDITADIPVNTPIVLNFESGSVRISNLNGPQVVRGTAGSISFMGSSNSVNLETRNGDIEAAFVTIPQDSEIMLRTSNGDVSVGFPPSTSVDVTATTSAGSVGTSGIDFSSRSLASNGVSAKFTARSGVGQSSLTATTFHGDVSFASWTPDPATINPPAAPQSAPDDTLETSKPDSVLADSMDSLKDETADSAVDTVADPALQDSIPRP